MGGVSATVLLKDNLTKSQEELLSKVLSSVSSELSGNDFWVIDTIPIAGSYRGEPRPFFLCIHTIEQRDESDLMQIRQKLDFDARYEIYVSANANGQDDSRILAELVYWISEEFNGLIDFKDLLLPNQYFKNHGYLNDIELEKAMHYVNPMKKLVAGRLTEITYTTNNKMWAFHVGDSEFMKNWLKSDDFKMFK